MFELMARDYKCPQNKWELTVPSAETRQKAKRKKKGGKSNIRLKKKKSCLSGQ